MKALATTLVTLALALCLSLTAAAQLNNPNGIAFDSNGNLWVANYGANQVLEMNPISGAVLNTVTQGLNAPTRLLFVGSQLWVANTNGNNITVYGNLGQQGATLVKTINNGNINKPLGLAVDAYGDVYVGNNSQNTVIALNIDNGLIETLSQDNSGFQFTAPGVLTIYGQNIYAAFGPDSGENAVISYNVGEFLTNDPNEITVYNDNVNTGPTGVAFDVVGNVYISEYTSGTAVEYLPSNPHHPHLVINQGTGGCEGIALDKAGNIYVSNAALNDITVYRPWGGAPIRTLY
jgi:sugar lactone lactonase YvrE